MPATTFHKTLKRAVDVAGSLPVLSAKLNVPPEQVQRWMDGGEPVPTGVFLALVDVLDAHSDPASTASHDYADMVVGELSGKALTSAMALHQTDLGNVQVMNADGNLEIKAHHGFGPEFLAQFRTVSVREGSACAAAFRSAMRVVVPDVRNDPLFVSSPESREAMLAAGAIGVQSTPILSKGGEVLGIVSTHFRAPLESADRLAPLEPLLPALAAMLSHLKALDEK